ncbi:MAG: hypothetical protein IJ438_11935 [Clostridia bacterium]|nr:hypothetical protein [Clostridia bacterium]
MKMSEGMGALIGSIVGALGTGIAIFFTGSPLCCLIGLGGYLAGSRIGKAVAGGKGK